jgi:hypothetical protein
MLVILPFQGNHKILLVVSMGIGMFSTIPFSFTKFLIASILFLIDECPMLIV